MARFWRLALWLSGYEIEKLIEMLSKHENVDPEKRDKVTEYITAQMNSHIGFQGQFGRTVRVSPITLLASYLSFMLHG